MDTPQHRKQAGAKAQGSERMEKRAEPPAPPRPAPPRPAPPRPAPPRPAAGKGTGAPPGSGQAHEGTRARTHEQRAQLRPRLCDKLDREALADARHRLQGLLRGVEGGWGVLGG